MATDISSLTGDDTALTVVHHWLNGPAVQRRETPNHGGKIEPDYLLMHYTAGRDAASSVRHFLSPAAQASAHLVIGRDGSITQLVAFNRKAWHAGISSWAGRNGLNQFSIGIELDNAGRLQRVGSRFQAWFGELYPPEQAIEAQHQHESRVAWWHAYTGPQIDAALRVAHLLVQTYRLLDVMGHDDVAPGRKVDPGPAFPMGSFRSRLFGRSNDVLPQFEVTAEALNVRGGPGTVFPLVRAPLAKGAVVSLLEMQALWAHVLLEEDEQVDGWVRNSFIRAL